MKTTAKHVVLGLFVSTPLAITSLAAQHRCNAPSGCSARIVSGGQQYEFTFSEGDTVDTSAGWIVSANDGWAPI